MSKSRHETPLKTSDALIDEVRGIRRNVCDQFENDVDELCDHLRDVERDYAARRGIFAIVTREAAARVAEAWSDTVTPAEDAIVDEVRSVRKKLGNEPSGRLPRDSQ